MWQIILISPRAGGGEPGQKSDTLSEHQRRGRALTTCGIFHRTAGARAQSIDSGTLKKQNQSIDSGTLKKKNQTLILAH